MLSIFQKKLSNEVEMPIIGLGTYLVDNVAEAVKYAIKEQNYQMIDTARFYNNEAQVGVGIMNSGVSRENIFITSKLWNTKVGRTGCLERVHDSLEYLKSDFIDQYLIHAPQGGKVLECYDTLLELQSDGLIKSVGVSNFGIRHLEAIKESGRQMPVVNQIELHPWCTNDDIVDYCNENNIVVVAYSPLTKGNKFNDPYIIEISRKYKKSPAQILIRWSLQKGFITIPKSSKTERIYENANVFDFCLTDQEMQIFDNFGKEEKIVYAWDPTINSMSEFGPVN